MMGKIYRNADQVIFYGGSSRDDEFDLKGIELVERLDKHFSPDYQAINDINNLFTSHQKKRQLPVQNTPDDITQNISQHTAAFQWLAEVGYGGWRQRLWMVQE
ncbi:hypothetical protein TruAng_004001 [Truncatella angustata]|nr:hypothetical protein TruAng_004001 [Truncatella angustata]